MDYGVAVAMRYGVACEMRELVSLLNGVCMCGFQNWGLVHVRYAFLRTRRSFHLV